MVEHRLVTGDDGSSTRRKEKKTSRRSSSRSRTRKEHKRRSSSRRTKSHHKSRGGHSSRRHRSARSSSRRSRHRSHHRRHRHSLNRTMDRNRRELVLKAQKKQMVLDCLHVLLLSLQLIIMIAIVVAAFVIYGFYPHMQKTYYMLQTFVESVLFVISGLSICHSNTFFRISLLSGHLCALVYSVFVIKISLRDHIEDGIPSIFTWPIESRFHLIYMSAGALVCHVILSLISIMIVFFYEGSIDHFNQTEKGSTGIEGELIAKEILDKQRHRKKSRRNVHCGIAIPRGSVLSQKEVHKKMAGVVMDEQGRPRGYATQIVSSRTTVCETPGAIVKNVTRKTDTQEITSKQERQKTQKAIPMEKSSKDSVGRNETVSASREGSTATANSATKSEKRAPGRFNSISKMPPLESPIAFLNRKENASHAKKSSYAF